MRIQHNIAALNSYRQLSGNNSALSKNLEKLSSGYRINRAGDDAAGLAISEKMRAQIKGLEAAQKNANDGISLVQTAEGALTEVHSMLNRMVYMATQSANGTYDDSVDRASLNAELETLKEEIDRISQATNFNGIKLLDGSMDSATKTVNNEISDGFKIADWVGTTANQNATVGDGTIVHTDGQKAQAAKFAVELNNSTATGDGVAITLGDNEKLELTKDEIKAGATAEEIASAFAEKYSEVTLKGADGTTDVKFNVTADGDRIVFEQAEVPKTEGEVVDTSMAVKYEGIGSPVAKEPALNTTELKPSVDASKNLAHVDMTNTKFTWDTNATDEAKDALNKIFENGINLKATVKADGTTAANVGAAAGDRKLDASELIDALSAQGYTVTAKEGATNSATAVITADSNNVYSMSADQEYLELTIKDENGDNVGKLAFKFPAKTGGLGVDAGTTGTPANATTNAELRSTITIGAGNNQAMNGDPAVTIDDKGGLEVSTGATKLFALESGLTTEQKDALNQVLASGGDQSIKLNLEGLSGNAAAATGTVLKAELSDALKEAGYYIATNDTTPASNKYNDDTGFAVGSGANATVYLYDKDNNKIATINIATKDNDGSAGKEITSETSTITLSASQFNSESVKTTASGAGLSEVVKVTLTPGSFDPDTETETDISSIDWAGTTANSLTWNDGDKLTVTIDGTDYEVTMQKGGLTEDQKNSGEVIDISTAGDVDTGAEVRALLLQAIQKQMNNKADAAAKGTDDYTKYTNLAFAADADDPSKLKVTSDTQKFTYVGDTAAADDGDDTASGVAGGKDPNASTVSIQTGATEGSGRLASTYITAEDLAGIKDGSQLKVGDKVYTFAVGKNSTATGDNIIKVNGEVGDSDLAKKALDALTNDDNAMFSIGHDGDRVTFTENKEYEWGEGVDLSTKDGIAAQFGFYVDGMTTETQGKSLTLQVGDTADDYQKVTLDIKDMSTAGLGIGDISIATLEDASAAVDKIKAAINIVSSQRGDLGAVQNRLEHTINNLGVTTENITAAESRIRDTDMAEEMMNYTKNNILVQAAQAMLAQANSIPQGVLQLLQ